jgi:Ca2+-binding EF-hand superfamily protein
MLKHLFGSLALATLLIGPSSAVAQQQPDPADQVFDQLDANKDGKLTMAEFTAHPDLSEEAFAACDTDKDKAISKTEFKARYGGK